MTQLPSGRAVSPSVVLAVDDIDDGPLVVHIEQAGPRPECVGCGLLPAVKDREKVELVDLPCFGRPTRLRWRKVRWVCRTGLPRRSRGWRS